MKKKSFLIFLMFIISGALFYFVYKRIGTKEIWNSLLSFSPTGILVVLFLMIVSHIIGIIRWKTILKDRWKKVNFSSLISSWLVGFGIVFFAPFAVFGSETMRAYGLKRKHKEISWRKSFVSVLIDKIFEGTTSFLMMFLGIVCLVAYSFLLPKRVWLLILILLLPIGAIVYFYIRVFKKQSMAKIIEKPLKKILNHRVKSVFEVEKEIFDFFRLENQNMKKGAWFALLRQLVDFLACFAILIFMGLKLSVVQAISVIGFVYLSYYVIPVPAAIGILELIEVLIFTNIGLNPKIGVAFVMLYRSFNFIFAILGIGLSFRAILHWFGEKIIEISEEDNH